MANSGTTKAPANSRSDRSGTYIAYGPDGNEIWKMEGFHIGYDSVPTGISIGMKAGRIVDPKSGERIAQWNPWNLL